MGNEIVLQRHRRSIVVVVVLVLLAGVSVIVWLVLRGEDHGADSVAVSSPSAGPTFSTADGALLETSLVSPDPETVASVLAAGFGDAYLEDGGGRLLPDGSTISIDPSSLVRGNELSTVDAEVTGPEPGSWQLTIARQDDAWLVVSAVPGP